MNMYMQKSSKLFVHYGSVLIETQTFYLHAIFFWNSVINNLETMFTL